MFLYLVSGGRLGGQVRGLNVLLLLTTGRKTAKPWTVPLGYIHDGSSYVVSASGFGRRLSPQRQVTRLTGRAPHTRSPS